MLQKLNANIANPVTGTILALLNLNMEVLHQLVQNSKPILGHLVSTVKHFGCIVIGKKVILVDIRIIKSDLIDINKFILKLFELILY